MAAAPPAPPLRWAPEDFVGRPDTDLPSPALCVDLDVAERNAARMAAKAAAAGLLLRPHVKTHKTLEGAALQTAGAPRGAAIVVSTIAEARAFAASGYTDILYGVPVEPSKLPYLWELHALPGMALRVLTDCAEGLAALQAHWRDVQAAGAAAPTAVGGEAPPPPPCARPWSVYLKLDATGYRRAGLPPGSPDVLALASATARGPGTSLHGLYAHSGNSYNCVCPEGGGPADAARAMAAAEVGALLDAARALAAAGVPVPVVSAGASPSTSAFDYAGVASAAPPGTAVEIHPGNYVFYDRQQVASGSCGLGDVAPYVLARVIGRYPHRGEALIDAGSCALHKDAGGLPDWGEVAGRPHLRLLRMTQEAAVVGRAPGAADAGAQLDADLALGAPVRVLPNHSCMTASGHAVYYATRGGVVQAVWRPVKGWY